MSSKTRKRNLIMIIATLLWVISMAIAMVLRLIVTLHPAENGSDIFWIETGVTLLYAYAVARLFQEK